MNEDAKKKAKEVTKVVLPTLGMMSLVGLILIGFGLMGLSLLAAMIFYELTISMVMFLVGAFIGTLGVVLFAKSLLTIRWN